MPQAILYPQTSGVVAIIHPMPEALERYGIEAIALKDVPAGVPFKIVDAADIPADRQWRNAWTVDPQELTDGVGAESNEFPPLANEPAGEAQEGGAA